MVLETADGGRVGAQTRGQARRGRCHRQHVHERKTALCDFYEEQIEDAYKTGVMFSLHVKATMMKVSHPIVFGHAVKIFYKDAFAKHGKLFDELGVNVNNGLSDLYEKIEPCPTAARRDHRGPAQVSPRAPAGTGDGGFGQGHLQLPLAVGCHRRCVDARDDRLEARCTAPDGRTGHQGRQPGVHVLPDVPEVINFCKTHGQFDPTTMGTVPNVGLMAQKAEEYGSHDKTFEIAADGVAKIIDAESGEVLLSQEVEAGDIWRMPIVRTRPSATG